MAELMLSHYSFDNRSTAEASKHRSKENVSHVVASVVVVGDVVVDVVEVDVVVVRRSVMRTTVGFLQSSSLSFHSRRRRAMLLF